LGVVEALLAAREAYERRDWVAMYERLSDLDSAALKGDDFARLAAAAYLTGRTNDCIQALQRAHQAHLDDGNVSAAARCAFWLAQTLNSTGESAIAGGWLARMRRLLDDVPDDVVERGYLQVLMMFRHISEGDFSAATECAKTATAYGRRFGDCDLLAVGMSSEGRLALYLGRVAEGITLLDEAMLGVVEGDVSTIFAGEVYCSMIEACQEISDFGRAAQWTMALTRWCAEQPGLVMFTGQCAVHRGQLMRIRGCYPEALQEFSLAVRRYRAAGSAAPAGLALTERGDVLRILGKFDAAEDAYADARQHGHEPQPGLALLWQARGRTGAATPAMRRLLAERRDDVGRSQLLPSAVQILLAADDVDGAGDASDELARIAADFGCLALSAMADYAAGSVALGRGDYAGAIPKLRDAARRWAELEAPYEVARCGVLIGRALGAMGDEDSAKAEFSTARAVFDQLGAVPAGREVAALLNSSTPGGLTSREVEVLRLVAAGRSNPEIADSLVLSEKTVARHLSNIFTKLDVGSRTAAAAFAFDHDIV
jgi:DNA-binding CsgD family transcriptional regulator